MPEKIPHNRLMLYVMLAGLAPVLIALVHFFSAQSNLDDLQNALEHIRDVAFVREKKQAINMALRNHFRDADHFYIDKHLETLSFLEQEVESLHKISENKNYADDESVKRRLEFLTGSGNAMAFTEGVVQSHPLFQETTETLVHPVEVNNSDLQKILARIEGVEIGGNTPAPHRPQLVVLDLKLDRKLINEKNEVFLLNLKLLKREFL